jgi:CO/xanthine dehydrogenase FAD-binding subunit
MAVYLRPSTEAEALAELGQRSLTVLAGGTDYYPSRVGKPLTDGILDISAIASLRGIRQESDDTGDHWRIGATTTWRDVIAAALPPLFDGLKLAAREVGGVQIQNAGTVAGNICNASPAADGVPALLALDARVELADSSGTNHMPLADFLLGNRRTRLCPGQLMTGILIPKPQHAAYSKFAKLGARKYLVISIVMVAATLEVDAGRVKAARVAVGSCSAITQRLPALEAALLGQTCDANLGRHVEAVHLSALTPMDDVRGSSEYRLDAGLTLVKRALGELGGRA